MTDLGSPRELVVSMSAQRWARVEDLFSRALAANPNERQRVITEGTAGDDMLRAAVESLLDEHAREPAFLEQVPAWLDAPAPLPDKQPERVGPYRILSTLGRGGMGTVYLAERETAEFRQHVALKVVRRGIDTDDVIARFHAEREILASLDHPNISRFLDVGANAGQPFLVMEYVDGTPILKFCDQHRLTVAERCELFRGICAAVHHAHRALIVHRDIKPSNVLVTRDRVPKLLDFGIAKVLDRDRQTGYSPTTQEGARLLTPEYAAPEQIRGEALTTACDVYALGVLLYELLAGCRPVERSTGTDDVRRSILEVAPPSPSVACRAETAAARRVSAAQLRRQLAGDLDTIVLKAVRKEPEARYASALSLAEDVERHLKGNPVHARPTSARYRIGKFVRRNRIAVLATAALLTTLAAASGVTFYQSQRIAAESLRVARERDKALEVRSFLLEMFGATGPDQPAADTLTARQLLDRRAADLKRARADDPEMRAEMMYVLAEGYDKLKLPAQAEPLAREALQLRRDVFGDRHPDVVASLNLLGWIMRERGDLAEAEPLLREAIAVGRAVFPPEGDPRLARALNDLGVVRADAADYREAATLYDESLTIRKRLLGERHIGVAITTSNLAVVLLRQQDLKGAAAMARSALALFRELLGEGHQRTANAKENLATMLSMQGDHEASAAMHRQILESRKRTLGERHPLVANSMTMVANQMRAFKQYAQAESMLAAALDILREAHGPRHNTIASTLRVLGDVKYDAGRPDEALKDYGPPRNIAQALGVSGRNELGIVLRRAARAREALGDHAGAERDLREFVRVARLAPTPSVGVEAQVFLLEFLVRRGRAVDSKALLQAIEAKPKSTLSQPLRERVAAARRDLGT